MQTAPPELQTIPQHQSLNAMRAAVVSPLIEALTLLMQLHERPISAQALSEGIPGRASGIDPAQAVRAMERHGFSARVSKRGLEKIPALALPVVLLLKNERACVLQASHADGTVDILLPETGLAPHKLKISDLNRDFTGWVFFSRPVHRLRKAGIGEISEGEDSSKNWLWKTLWRYKSYYMESIVAALLLNILGLALSIFIMNVYDRVVPNRAFDTLWVLSLGVGIALLLELILRTVRCHFLETAAKKADLTISSQLFSHVLGGRLETRPAYSGALASQMRDFESVRDFITSATLVTLTDIPFTVLFIAVIGLFGGSLAWVAILSVPLIIAVGVAVQWPINASIQEHMRDNSFKQGVLVEAVDGLEALKAVGAEGFALGRWERACASTARTSVVTRNLSSLAQYSSQFILQAATVVAVIYGVYLIAEGKMTQGALIGCIMLLGRALAPISQVTSVLARYQHAKSAYEGLQKLMQAPLQRDPQRTYLHRPHLEGDIRLQDLQFAYPGPLQDAGPLVDVKALHIRPGEHIAILGKLGSGKSTLLKIIAGLYKPQRGMVLLDGTDLQQIDPADVRHNLAVLTQEVRLFRATLRENLLLGNPHADQHTFLTACDLCGVDEWAKRHPLGYDMPIGEKGEGLSGGQRQTVALARALITGAPVMLFDEPTSALDQGTEQALIRRLQAVFQDRTLVLVTHKPAMLALVDRIVVLDAGRVVADGPRDNILAALSGAKPDDRKGGL